MSFFVRVLYSGKLDTGAFVAALEATLQRHPLLHARVVGNHHRDMAWVESPQRLPWLDVAEEGVPMLFPGSFRIDLRKENGLRIWIRHNGDHGEIRFQFNHVCCDGVAANQFLADVLGAYDREQRGSATAADRPLEVEELRRRHCLGLPRQHWLMRAGVAVWAAIIRMPQFFLTRPMPLQAPPDTSGHAAHIHDTMVPELLTWRFDKPQLHRLLAAAKQRGVTLNDLMIRDFFHVMREWNSRHGLEKGRFLRILVPFNLRRPEHDRLPATNVMGLIHIDRSFKQLSRLDLDGLLENVHDETQCLKRTQLPAAFTHAMAVGEKTMGSLERIFRTDRCLTTAVLSNLGRIFTDTPLRRHEGKLLAGDLVVEAIDTAPPVRTGSGFSCTVYTYAGQMSLSLLYDRRCFTSAVAMQLLNRLAAQIEQSMGTVAQHAPESTTDVIATS